MARISEFLNIEAPSGPWEDAGSTSGLWGGCCRSKSHLDHLQALLPYFAAVAGKD